VGADGDEDDGGETLLLLTEADMVPSKWLVTSGGRGRGRERSAAAGAPIGG